MQMDMLETRGRGLQMKGRSLRNNWKRKEGGGKERIMNILERRERRRKIYMEESGENFWRINQTYPGKRYRLRNSLNSRRI